MSRLRVLFAGLAALALLGDLANAGLGGDNASEVEQAVVDATIACVS